MKDLREHDKFLVDTTVEEYKEYLETLTDSELIALHVAYLSMFKILEEKLKK